MRRNLAINISYPDVRFEVFVTGDRLLQWLKEDAERLRNLGWDPAQTGTQIDPWVLKEHRDWVAAWSKLNRDPSYKTRDIYLKVGGRLIIKHKKEVKKQVWQPKMEKVWYYPPRRRSFFEWEDHGRYKPERDYGWGDGFYMADVALSGQIGAGEGTIWNREGGASYREIAKFMAGRMEGTTHHDHDQAGGVSWSKAKAYNLWQVIRARVDYAGKLSTSSQAALPLLATVMLVAEAGRNSRTFHLGLMMIELIGRSYSSTGRKFYTWDRVLAHPDRVSSAYRGSSAPSKTQRGPFRDQRNKRIIRSFGNYAQQKDLVYVEGKWSASPSMSASAGDAIDVVNDYIQQKEVSILTRWLAAMMENRYGEGSVYAMKDSESTAPRLNLFSTSGSTLPGLSALHSHEQIGVINAFDLSKKEVIDDIKALIKSRGDSLNSLLIEHTPMPYIT